MLKKFLPILFSLFFMTGCSSYENDAETPIAVNPDRPVAVIDTEFGAIEVELFTDKVPETAKNFVELARQGKYDEVSFHRIIKNFMIQGGDFTNRDGTGGHSYKGEGTTIDDEYSEGLSNARGTLSMANRGPNTNGSQFFINLKDNTFLDGRHPVFGKVVKGMEAVDAIAQVKTGANDRPMKNVIMKSVKMKE